MSSDTRNSSSGKKKGGGFLARQAKAKSNDAKRGTITEEELLQKGTITAEDVLRLNKITESEQKFLVIN